MILRYPFFRFQVVGGRVLFRVRRLRIYPPQPTWLVVPPLLFKILTVRWTLNWPHPKPQVAGEQHSDSSPMHLRKRFVLAVLTCVSNLLHSCCFCLDMSKKICACRYYTFFFRSNSGFRSSKKLPLYGLRCAWFLKENRLKLFWDKRCFPYFPKRKNFSWRNLMRYVV